MWHRSLQVPKKRRSGDPSEICPAPSATEQKGYSRLFKSGLFAQAEWAEYPGPCIFWGRLKDPEFPVGRMSDGGRFASGGVCGETEDAGDLPERPLFPCLQMPDGARLLGAGRGAPRSHGRGRCPATQMRAGKSRTPGQTEEDALRKILRRVRIPGQLPRKRLACGSECVVKARRSLEGGRQTRRDGHGMCLSGRKISHCITADHNVCICI